LKPRKGDPESPGKEGRRVGSVAFFQKKKQQNKTVSCKAGGRVPATSFADWTCSTRQEKGRATETCIVATTVGAREKEKRPSNSPRKRPEPGKANGSAVLERRGRKEKTAIAFKDIK